MPMPYFFDYHEDLQMVAEGDKVVVRFIITGAQLAGDLCPTGKAVRRRDRPAPSTASPNNGVLLTPPRRPAPGVVPIPREE